MSVRSETDSSPSVNRARTRRRVSSPAALSSSTESTRLALGSEAGASEADIKICLYAISIPCKGFWRSTSYDGAAAQQHQADHGNGARPRHPIHVFAIERGRDDQGHECLQKLDLAHAGGATERQSGVPGEEAEVLAYQGHVSE